MRRRRRRIRRNLVDWWDWSSHNLEAHSASEFMRTDPQALSRQFVVLLRFSAQVLLLAVVGCLAHAQGAVPPIHANQDEPLPGALKALQDDRLDEALRILTTAENEQPSDARIRNFRGIVLVRLGRNNEAADEYREAIHLDPNLEDAYKNLGFLDWTEHRLEDARATLQRAVELDPADSFAHYYLGRVELDAGLYESAFQELDRSGIAWPEDPQFLIEAANGYLALKRQAKAREIADRLSTMRLSDREIAVAARLLLSTGNNSAAIDLLRRLTERQNPACPRWAQSDLALSYLTDGNNEKAAAQAQSVANGSQLAGASSEEAAWLWSVMGIAKARLGNSGAAVRALREAAKLDSHREEYWLNLTRELMETNREEAIAAAQEALQSNPQSYALNLRLGAAYLSLDRYAESENVFRRLVAAGDPLPTSYVGLAQVLLRTGRAREAAAELSDAGKKLGPNFLISYFQGLALNRAGQAVEAIAAFQEAIRLSPDNSEARLGLGQAELRAGHNNEAIAELQKCLQFSPGNAQAKRLLSQAYRRVGDTQAALRYSQEGQEKEQAPENELLGDFILPEWQGP